MAVNPAEDIVNVWLQDAQGFFTRQNVNVPKGKRMINGKAIYGGRGKEIDILATNMKGEKLWVEVTVSPNPYLGKSASRISDAMKIVQDKFCPEKETEVRRLFGKGRIRKLFIYSRRIFRKEQEGEFIAKLNALGQVEAKPFEEIFDETINGINHYSVDPVRIYLYYSKYFGKILPHRPSKVTTESEMKVGMHAWQHITSRSSRRRETSQALRGSAWGQRGSAKR